MADPRNPDRGAQVPPDPKGKKKKSPGDINVTFSPAPATGSKFDQFKTWALKHGIKGATITDIWYWSQHTPNVDPYLWSSVLLAESGAKHLSGNGKIVSSGQAVGIGQIALSWIGQPVPWDKTGRTKFTGDNDPKTGIGNYGVNLRMSAYLWGSAVGQVGWQNAYLDKNVGYNSHDANAPKAWKNIEKTYASRPTGNPPTGSPSTGPADTSAAAQQGNSIQPPVFNDPYISGMTKQGKFTTTLDPNKAMQYNGAPLTRSAFLTVKDGLTSHYVSYTGGRPTDRQIITYISQNWNTYTLDLLLSHGKKFTNSPIYKQYSANLGASLADLMPKGQKVPEDLIRQAAVNGWSADAVAAKLRKMKGYTNSKEFSGNVATLMNVHTSIMGNPDPGAMVSIKDAALAGWNADQYAAYLRAQPAYRRSPEYQSKALTILGALGLITGARPILAKGVEPGPGALGTPVTGKISADPRVPGKPSLQDPLGSLGVTLK